VKNQLGQDRVTSGTPMVFGEEWGNLDGASLVYDYSDEVNVGYGGGAGEEDYRYIYLGADLTRVGSSPWNRREKFIDARNSVKLEVQSKTKEAIREGEPVTRFSGTLLEGANSLYGVQWNFGDLVSATYCGKTFTGMIKAIKIDVDESGKETISARMEI
jgi:hypothetical protein